MGIVRRHSPARLKGRVGEPLAAYVVGAFAVSRVRAIFHTEVMECRG